MLYSSARQLQAALGWRTRTCFRSDQQSPPLILTKAKVTLLQLWFLWVFFSSRKVQFLLLDKRFNQMRQVQYLANGVKVENPVYLLSNEMLKLIYDPYEAIMQIFHVV